MRKELPEIPLEPKEFAREMHVGYSKVVRVMNSPECSIQLVDGRIPVSDYPILYQLIVDEPRKLEGWD